MKIAIAGKGGSGKTTVAGTLARLLARSDHQGVLAIDADSNPNLALTLGLPPEASGALAPLPRDILHRETALSGAVETRLSRPPDEVINQYGVSTPDGVTLLLMGRVDHAAAG
ncbi:nucleotide-binding protein [Candidatus Entotheonella palauensis]|uniref:CobQ/CobB/MinD/ParA nucleotide binding domain-containing protein n=1 Tax=Candidatus Entotheonella gemina TaxID=1429439 RepID=W4MBF3_9BACT|nr:AAA family ATPase [Candidatus Entotheonella palauensis]ETX07515.1 MAG: hypothetical protein ETSY2_10755 [Candidatus Entotheonella gemina]